MHTNSLLAFNKHILPHFRDGMRVLEVGPEKRGSTYRQRITAEIIYLTADIRDRPIDFGQVPCADETHIVAENDSFHIVFACNVLEHVRRPWLWVAELARITKPGGIVALVAPITIQYHRAPVDCWRVYPQGARALMEDAGLDRIFARVEQLDDSPQNGNSQIGGVPCQDLVAIGRVPA